MAKKLKRIPNDLVSYVQSKGKAAKDFNDKETIISYAQHKIEIIDWYIKLLDNNSKKYIVPHSREYLVSYMEQLSTAIQEVKERYIPVCRKVGTLIIEDPEGYEG
jgi:superfamily II DNA helicase RecQ